MSGLGSSLGCCHYSHCIHNKRIAEFDLIKVAQSSFQHLDLDGSL